MQLLIEAHIFAVVRHAMTQSPGFWGGSDFEDSSLTGVSSFLS